MAILALVLTLAWVVVVSAVPTYRQVRTAGRIALPVRDPRGSAQWWSRRISTFGFACAIAAPLADIAGLPRLAPLDVDVVRIGGVVLVVLGIAGALYSQAAMGASWRGDVDPDARTALVTGGPYRLVRNPILTSTAMTALGLALIVPNAIAVAMLAAFIAGMQIQVRRVEEPHLERVHGEAWRSYAARTGRFLPRIGRGR